MWDKDFLKNLCKQKQFFLDIQWNNELQLQEIIRQEVDNPKTAIMLTEFILNQKKFVKKFPQLIQSQGFICGKVCEQATSERLASHKASFFKGNQFLDLTAGLAIDSMAFAKNFSMVTAIEINPNLIPFLEWNARQLNIENIKFIHSSAEAFLARTPTKSYDLIYLDPSRNVHNKKVYHPKDCSPNIFKLLPQLQSLSNKVLIKLSPMIEIKELEKWFSNIEYIWVISKNDECKEILILLNSQHTQPPSYRLSILKNLETFVYEFHIPENSAKITPQPYNYHDLLNYQYVLLPDVCFIKAHLINELQNKTQGLVTSLHDGIIFIKKIPETYYGKIKEIIQIISLKDFSEYQRKKQLWKAHVIAKHFPIKVEEIRKKWKIREGNEDAVLFIEHQKQKIVIHTKNITDTRLDFTNTLS